MNEVKKAKIADQFGFALEQLELAKEMWLEGGDEKAILQLIAAATRELKGISFWITPL